LRQTLDEPDEHIPALPLLELNLVGFFDVGVEHIRKLPAELFV
jgi:hypothetical protein